MHFHSLALSSVTRPIRDAVVLGFAVPEALRERFRFTPGQYLTLRAEVQGETLRRPYSICSSPAEPELRVAIKRVNGGAFSNWANDRLRVGDELEVLPPQGRFTLSAPQGPRHVLAFAAGSGITPIVSIVAHTLATEAQSRCTLFFGNRSHGSTLFREALCDLKDRYLERFQLGFVMSREHQDLDLLNGRIDAAKCAAIFARWVPLATVDQVMVCGPESMIDAVCGALSSAGFPEARVGTERFLAAAPSQRRRAAPQAAGPAEVLSEIVVVQDGVRKSFQLARDGLSILDGAAAAGIELPHSCKGGMCSTCRARVIEGEVDMDLNYALEDYEIARGDVLCCQSFPQSDRVVLDFDQP